MMTEQEWLASADPRAMLAWLTDTTAGPCLLASDRKLRLFACACCRQVWDRLTDGRSRRAVLVAEQYADGQAADGERALAESNARAAGSLVVRPVWTVTYLAALAAAGADLFDPADVSYQALKLGQTRACQADLLRCLFAPPGGPEAADPTWLNWGDGTVGKMVQTIHDEGAFDHLPILADALEEAGCTDQIGRAHV